MVSRKYLIIDHNIFITAKHIIRKNKEISELLSQLFELLKMDFLFYTLKNKYQEDFAEVIPKEDTRFIEEYPENFKEAILNLAYEFGFRCGIDIYDYFKNDDDKDNDLTLLAFAFYIKDKQIPFLLLHRENKIRYVCRNVGLNDCCLLHIIDCFIKQKFDEFQMLKKAIQGSQINHPKWIGDIDIDCSIIL